MVIREILGLIYLKLAYILKYRIVFVALQLVIPPRPIVNPFIFIRKYFLSAQKANPNGARHIMGIKVRS